MPTYRIILTKGDDIIVEADRVTTISGFVTFFKVGPTFETKLIRQIKAALIAQIVAVDEAELE